MYGSLAALAVFTLWMFVWKAVPRILGPLLRAWTALPVPARLVLAVFVSSGILYGGSKGAQHVVSVTCQNGITLQSASFTDSSATFSYSYRSTIPSKSMLLVDSRPDGNADVWGSSYSTEWSTVGSTMLGLRTFTVYLQGATNYNYYLHYIRSEGRKPVIWKLR